MATRAVALSIAVLLLAGAARAEEPQPAPASASAPASARGWEETRGVSLLERPHTIAVLEAGIIALPTAPISAANRGGNTPLGKFFKGDATLQTGIHLLYRPSRTLALGAGAMFAPNPTSDAFYTSPNQNGQVITRTHSRNYLFLGGELRYFFPELRLKNFEGWFGFTGGGIIVADRFTTNGVPDVPQILGSSTVTVRNEGFALGVQAGADYLLSDAVVVGLAGRASIWLLPNVASSQEASCDALGDCPTLTGAVQAFEVGITLGYRIPL